MAALFFAASAFLTTGLMFSGPGFSFIGRMEGEAVLGGKGWGLSGTLLQGLDTRAPGGEAGLKDGVPPGPGSFSAGVLAARGLGNKVDPVAFCCCPDNCNVPPDDVAPPPLPLPKFSVPPGKVAPPLGLPLKVSAPPEVLVPDPFWSRGPLRAGCIPDSEPEPYNLRLMLKALFPHTISPPVKMKDNALCGVLLQLPPKISKSGGFWTDTAFKKAAALTAAVTRRYSPTGIWWNEKEHSMYLGAPGDERSVRGPIDVKLLVVVRT